MYKVIIVTLFFICINAMDYQSNCKGTITINQGSVYIQSQDTSSNGQIISLKTFINLLKSNDIKDTLSEEFITLFDNINIGNDKICHDVFLINADINELSIFSPHFSTIPIIREWLQQKKDYDKHCSVRLFNSQNSMQLFISALKQQ